MKMESIAVTAEIRYLLNAFLYTAVQCGLSVGLRFTRSCKGLLSEMPCITFILLSPISFKHSHLEPAL